jgi:hypothetical protein
MGTYEDTPEVPNIVLLAERQRGLARSVGDLLKWRNGRDGMDAWRAVTDDRIEGLEGKIVALTKAVDALRRTILGFALTIAGSCVVFSLSVLIATGKI